MKVRDICSKRKGCSSSIFIYLLVPSSPVPLLNMGWNTLGIMKFGTVLLILGPQAWEESLLLGEEICYEHVLGPLPHIYHSPQELCVVKALETEDWAVEVTRL